MKNFIFSWLIILISLQALTQTKYAAPVESDYVINNFKFVSGELLPRLNIHYTTIGQPIKDRNGNIINAILIMHGTTGGGYQFLFEQFANNLYGDGQILDAKKIFYRNARCHRAWKIKQTE